MKISINKIIPNPQQPRKEFDETSLAELANSIKLHGLINPITVEEAGDHYILIAGERRWRAAQIAGMEDIEATVRPGLNGNGAQERLLLTITENLHREDMNVIETAQAYKNMLDMGFSVQDIALTISKNPGTINRYLSMLDFPKEIVDLYKSGQLKNEANSIAALKGIKDKPLQVKVAQSAARNNMSSPAITRFIKRMSFKTNKRSHEKIEQKKNMGESLEYDCPGRAGYQLAGLGSAFGS